MPGTMGIIRAGEIATGPVADITKIEFEKLSFLAAFDFADSTISGICSVAWCTAATAKRARIYT